MLSLKIKVFYVIKKSWPIWKVLNHGFSGYCLEIMRLNPNLCAFTHKMNNPFILILDRSNYFMGLICIINMILWKLWTIINTLLKSTDLYSTFKTDTYERAWIQSSFPNWSKCLRFGSFSLLIKSLGELPKTFRLPDIMN